MINLFKRQLLTHEEIEALKEIGLEHRATVVWSWIYRICNECLIIGNIPPPNRNQFQVQCLRALSGRDLLSFFTLTAAHE